MKILKREYDLIYFVGDSFVYAIDMAEDDKKEITIENRFSALVAKHYGLKEVNCGMSGAGNLQITKQLYKDMFQYKTDKKNPLVVVVYSDPNRIEVFSNKHEKLVTLNPEFSFFKNFLVESFNEKFNKESTYFYIDSVRSILNFLNFDYIEANSITPVMLNKSYFSHNTFVIKHMTEIAGKKGSFQAYTPDNLPYLGHLNILGHELVSQKIIDKINELYGKN